MSRDDCQLILVVNSELEGGKRSTLFGFLLYQTMTIKQNTEIWSVCDAL